MDWCAFRTETNEKQRTRYAQDLKKLQTLWKTFKGKKAIDMQAKEWRSIKVEPGTEAQIPRPIVAITRFPSRTKEEHDVATTKSCLEETRDCNGNFKSEMEFDVYVQGSLRDQSEDLVDWKKELVLERLQELESLMEVVHLELKDLCVKRVQCLVRVEAATAKCKQLLARWTVANPKFSGN